MSDAIGTTSTLAWDVTPPSPIVGWTLQAGGGAIISSAAGSTATLGGASALGAGPSNPVLLTGDTARVARPLLDAGGDTITGPGIVLRPDGTALVPYLGAPLPYPYLSARYLAPRGGPLALRVSGADLQAAVGGTNAFTLNLVLYLASGGTVTLSRALRLDDVPPVGLVTALLSGGRTYLTYTELSLDAAFLTVYRLDGGTATAPVTTPLEGVTSADGDGTPLKVTATDAAGNEGPDLLVRVLRDRAQSLPPAPLAPWPLPTYMDPSESNLAALLRAFELALDVGADRAGDALDLDLAEGADLDRLARMYGIYRKVGERDIELAGRVQALLVPNKQSPRGLELTLTRNGAPGATVVDLAGLLGRDPYRLNGAWKLDGTVNLGGLGVRGFSDGMFVVYYDEDPRSGWDAVRKVVARHKSAGYKSHVRRRVKRHPTLYAPPRAFVRARVRATSGRSGALTLTLRSGRLMLDGTWNLSGAQDLDSWRVGPPAVRILDGTPRADPQSARMDYRSTTAWRTRVSRTIMGELGLDIKPVSIAIGDGAFTPEKVQRPPAEALYHETASFGAEVIRVGAVIRAKLVLPTGAQAVQFNEVSLKTADGTTVLHGTLPTQSVIQGVDAEFEFLLMPDMEESV